jgi:RTA1 like protein
VLRLFYYPRLLTSRLEVDALENVTNIGTAQAYDSSQSQAYRNVGSGLMLGGLFFQVVLWIIYLIFFAKFQSRLHREGGINLTEDKAACVRTTSLALYINILTFMVILDKLTLTTDSYNLQDRGVLVVDYAGGGVKYAVALPLRCDADIRGSSGLCLLVSL